MRDMEDHPGTPEQAKGYPVLVVGDELPLAEVVASYLEREQFEAVVAGNGVGAIAPARDLDPDIVILDIGLPGIDGHISFVVAASLLAALGDD
ncbi:putative transcriptional regulatory protein TcrX [Mycolicibacterium chubuense]|uniref:Putative transcriptional regulatory protein TcrX n=1 Tax=Mycolicibacterium chubuense TaxID=1800 RepID=A0A0J6WA81_MYCCU|nr:putative transcriptional regulatory protein TcrX [Mycolicibacterium chubuense]SPX96278.1 response regulator receiver protein [Mycolicibacterium chubuense]